MHTRFSRDHILGSYEIWVRCTINLCDISSLVACLCRSASGSKLDLLMFHRPDWSYCLWFIFFFIFGIKSSWSDLAFGYTFNVCYGLFPANYRGGIVQCNQPHVWVGRREEKVNTWKEESHTYEWSYTRRTFFPDKGRFITRRIKHYTQPLHS